MEKNIILKLDSVWKIYKMGNVEVPALRGITLDIYKKDFIAITGASGSGKSTMMHIMGCLDLPTRGNVYLKSQNTRKISESDMASFRAKTIGFIFQQYNLIPSLTALENVMLPQEFLNINDKEAIKRAKTNLTLVGLKDKFYNKPNQLSGGEQQRVSIARSLANEPEIILADEPTGALDSSTGEDVLNLLQKLWEQGKTIILVTHDIELTKYAHRIVKIKDGKILSIRGR
jgi:putative ABC transport system ATP-binding protein